MGFKSTRSEDQFFVGSADDRPLPALEKLRLQLHQKEPGLDMTAETDDEPEPLTDSQWNDLVDIINAFGESVTRCLVSKQFAHKESAIKQLMERLDRVDIKDVSKAFLILEDGQKRKDTIFILYYLFYTFLSRVPFVYYSWS